MKLSIIMIYVAVIGAIVFGIMTFFNQGVNEGLITTNNNDTRMQTIIDSTQEIYNVTSETKDDLQELQGNPSVLDILGSVISGAYGALKTTGATYNTAYTVTTVSMSYIPMGPMSSIFTDTASLVLLIVIFIGIFLAAYIKWESI